MIGKKLYKNNKDDMAQYTSTAQWCNANDAHIIDRGSYYEVCKNVIPEPTKEEKLAELDAQYDKDKAEIIKYYNEAIFAEDTKTMADLKEEMAEIDAKYKADRKAIEEGSEE